MKRAGILCAAVFGLACHASFAQEDIVDKTGCVDRARFDREWRKYSDLDDRINLEARSSEAQQVYAKDREIIDAEQDIAKKAAVLELEREKRLALKDYQQALAQGLKTNLLKAFWRLTWITYNTAGGPIGTSAASTGRKVSELILEESESKIGALAKLAGIAKNLVPKKYSKLPGKKGKVINVGVEATLEGVEKFGEGAEAMGKAAAAQSIKTAVEEILPEADLEPEEIAILQEQNKDNVETKKEIAESYERSKELQAEIDALHAQIEQAKADKADSILQEKGRTLGKLDEHCKQLPLKVVLHAPERAALGVPIALSADVSGGSGEYKYIWYSARPSAKSGGLPGNGATMPGGDSVLYSVSAAGPQLVGVRVFDEKQALDGFAATTIDVVDPKAVPHAPPPAAPPKPAAPSGRDRWGNRLLQTLTVTGTIGHQNPLLTSFVAEKGKNYVIEGSGLMTIAYYSEKGNYLKTDVEDPIFIQAVVAGSQDHIHTNALQLKDPDNPGVRGASLEDYVDYPSRTGGWRQYNPEHLYRAEFVGRGKPIAIFYDMGNYAYGKSTGQFIVNVYEETAPPSGSKK